MQPAFTPGRELCRRFSERVVQPLLKEHMPSLKYATALPGSGSEVLGFDTDMSRDHDWGVRLQLFVREQDRTLIPKIDEILSQHLPTTFAGFAVDMALNKGDDHDIEMVLGKPVEHNITITTLRDFVQKRLAYDIQKPLEVADWLTIPSQELLALTANPAYHDEIKDVTNLQARLSWYPHDVWLYLLAAGWQRIGQEEHLMPRAGFVDDEPGSALIGSRLVHDIMALCFLMEKRYAPYPKWFGSAFKQLHCAKTFTPHLWQAQTATTWQEREKGLAECYRQLARMHNQLGLTKKLSEETTSFFERPFQVIYGETFAQALSEKINNPAVQTLTHKRLIGSIDQWSDSTDIRAHIPLWRSTLRNMYT